jgi:hypothetical protein
VLAAAGGWAARHAPDATGVAVPGP